MIITLCGSARFENHFKIWNEVLSLAGHTVFSLAVYPSDKKNVKTWYTEQQKLTLDKVHKDKILASDAVLFLNRFGYMGESTLSELDFAHQADKRIFMLESWAEGNGICEMHHQHIQDAVQAIIPEYKGSPVCTASYEGALFARDLLGNAGPERSALLKMVADFEEIEEGKFKPSAAG